MDGKTQRLLPWHRSTLAAAVDYLTEGWNDEEPLDLADLLVVVQTKGAGRRLRMALACRADERGQGMFPPRLVSPAFLIRPSEVAEPVASELGCLLRWMEVLGRTDLSAFSALFPKPPDDPDAGWARALAKSLHRLRKSLSEGDLDCAAVVRSGVAEQWGEGDRWRNLAELERQYREAMRSAGLRDRLDASRESARTPRLPDGIGRVLVLGVSGFPELARIALEKLVEGGVPVEVVAFGPEGEAFEDLFEEWGRPRRGAWEKRPVPLADEQIFLFHDERTQGKAVVSALKSHGDDPSGRVALGVTDAELKPVLRRLGEEGELPCALTDPEGTSAASSSLYALLAAVAVVLGDSSFRQVGVLLRFPEMWRWLENEGVGLNPSDLLRALDRLGSEHLPVTLENAGDLAWGDLRGVLEKVFELISSLEGDGFAENLRSFLLGATSGREFSRDEPADAGYLALANPLSKALEELEAEKVKGVVAFPLLLEVLRGQRVLGEAEPGALPMQGWLELPWEAAPRLLLAGFNEGCVPEAMPGDAFLPENLRRELGLWTSEVRFARDSYLLQWILASREGGGRVDVLLGKWRSAGDYLKPSRLLFLCDSGEESTLPARVQRLFAEPVRDEENPAWRFAWRLNPGPSVSPETISVTSFSGFLACPYRFHLKRFLRMESFNPLKNEVDVMDFGTLVHKVLQRFGEDEKICESDDEVVIRDYLRVTLDEVFRKRYGANPGLPVVQQKHSAWLRLSRAAKVQAEERRSGWVPIRSEDSFEKELDGILVRGKVDRIDRHEVDGSIRVLDYKTSDALPEEAHWGSVTRDPEQFPEYARFQGMGKNGKSKERRWTGLQLPLYRWWAGEDANLEITDKEVAVGYFNLPADAEAVGVTLWDELDDGLMVSAMACASGVIGDLKAGLTCSPRAKVMYDDFEDLFFHDSTLATIPLGGNEGESSS